MLLVFTVLSEGVARGNDEFTPLPFSLTTSAATLDTMVVYDALLFAAHMKRARKYRNASGDALELRKHA